MRKNHKHHRSAVAVPRSVPSAKTVAPAASALNGLNWRRVVLQLTGILGLSAVLGFTFNAANPIGVHFGGVSRPGGEPVAVVETNVAPAVVEIPASGGQVQTDIVATATPLPGAATVVKAENTTPALSPLPPIPIANPPTIPELPVVAQPAVDSPAPPVEPNPAVVHWRQARPLVEAGLAVLVDVRPRPAYDAGHIPGAVSLPESSPLDQFTAFLSEHPDKTLIVYCSSTSCSQSERVAQRLVIEFHRSSVKYMTGGYQEYQREELSAPKPDAGS